MDGNGLKAWRTAWGVTQQQLAERLGVTPNTVARWERGELPASPLLEAALPWIEIKLRLERKPRNRRRYRRRGRSGPWARPGDRELPADSGLPDLPRLVSIDTTRLRQLLQLCHPDKHSGSKTANDITAWLNRIRRQAPT